MKYYSILDMLNMIDEPNRSKCIKLYNDNLVLFKTMPGSSHNHQAWLGGYHDHIAEVMNICILLYSVYQVRQLNFTLSDALLVMFLHDLEKPWKKEMMAEIEAQRTSEDMRTRAHYYFDKHCPKHKRKAFRNLKIEQSNIILNEQQQNALDYVEGENDDYSNKKRVMNELAGFCHVADVTSSRIYWAYGKTSNW